MTNSDDIDKILGVQSSPQAEARGRRAPIPITPDTVLKLARRPTRRKFHNYIRAEHATRFLAGLPERGETWHCLMDGSWDGFDLVDAILDLANPSRIDFLHLATLGFNGHNASHLLELMDQKRVGITTMIVSAFYESDHKEKDTCYRLSQELPRRGGWYLATRSHAKVIAAKLDDGRHFIVESSANLRTCHNLEQFTLTQDRELYEFHLQWMEQAYEAEKAAKARGAGDGVGNFGDGASATTAE